MSNFDAKQYEESQRVKRERLAPLFARLPENYPPGMISVGPGWFDLVLSLDETLAEIDPDYTIAQVKEKFGGLRYYANPSATYTFDGDLRDSPFFKAITAAEADSFRTCEDCGAPGREVGGGWIIVLCEACETARDGDRKIK